MSSGAVWLTAASIARAITWRQTSLLHGESDYGCGTWIPHRLMFTLVPFNQINQNIKLFSVRASALGIHESIDTGEYRCIVGSGPDRSDFLHRTLFRALFRR